jgi:hypothetical protein
MHIQRTKSLIIVNKTLFIKTFVYSLIYLCRHFLQTQITSLIILALDGGTLQISKYKKNYVTASYIDTSIWKV